MIQQVWVKDVFETYSYFYINDKTKHGFLIDPGAEAERLLQIITRNDWVIEKVLLTHGHFDHTGAVASICEALNIPYMIHENGAAYLTDAGLNLSSYCRRNIILENAEYFQDGEIIKPESDTNDDFGLQVIHTPGHTPDSVVLYNKKDHAAFVGDTIFRGSIGSTGYPGGDMSKLQDSIVHRIFQLPEDTRLYSGHSEVTTVGTELYRCMR